MSCIYSIGLRARFADQRFLIRIIIAHDLESAQIVDDIRNAVQIERDLLVHLQFQNITGNLLVFEEIDKTIFQLATTASIQEHQITLVDTCTKRSSNVLSFDYVPGNGIKGGSVV